jgi:hypothetical protein
MESADLKKAVADRLAMLPHVPRQQAAMRGSAAPRAGLKLPRIDWHKALDGADDFLEEYLPTIGPLAPAQVQAFAAVIAEFIHLANQQVNPESAA